MKNTFWKAALNRSRSASYARLQSAHASRLGRAAQMEKAAQDLCPKINAAMDRIADAADTRYGDWNTWRRNPKLLRRVIQQMDQASRPLRQKQAKYLKEAALLRQPYLKEKAILDQTHDRLLREAGAPGPPRQRH